MFKSSFNLIQFVISRPASDFKSLDFSQVYFCKDRQDGLHKLLDAIRNIQLVCFRDPIDTSFLSYLKPDKIEELALAFQNTSLPFWEDISKFSNLRKLEVNMIGTI